MLVDACLFVCLLLFLCFFVASLFDTPDGPRDHLALLSAGSLVKMRGSESQRSGAHFRICAFPILEARLGALGATCRCLKFQVYDKGTGAQGWANGT